MKNLRNHHTFESRTYYLNKITLVYRIYKIF